MIINMDTLKAIQVFVCIAHQGNLSKAAQHLNYSKAMVSRYLEHLEATFSTRLFQRNTRKVSLTLRAKKRCFIVKISYSNNSYLKVWLHPNSIVARFVLLVVYFYFSSV